VTARCRPPGCHELSGHAKAMVVVESRVEALRWQLATEKYIKSNNYRIGTLVAFSGRGACIL
jgi:type I restriction enzyme, R subunit